MTVFIVIILLILALFLTAAAFDIVPFGLNILRRRGIGSFSSGDEWFGAAKSAAEKWLEKGFPAVPRVVNERLRIIDVLKGEYKVKAIQHWQKASVLLAMNEISPEKSAEYIKSKIAEMPDEISRVDTAMLAFAALENGKADSADIKKFADKTAEMLMKKYEQLGRIPYGGNENICFVDTVGLVCPFLVKYGIMNGNDSAVLAAVDVINSFYEKGIHKELGLPIHCFDNSNNAPLGIYGWGRGCGWWAVGLADTYRVLLQADGFESEKKSVLEKIIEFADAITRFQCKNGAFDRNVLCFSGEDSSATAMLAYFLAYAAEITGNDKYKNSAEKAVNYIYSVTRRSGIVDWSQGDTIGVGFYSDASIVVPAAQGFALRAYMMIKEGLDS